ncbi:MAG: hypothetical protein GX279_03775 [Clostridiaceae bacterium]|nr:hypothetical protein [Clostridiaceae bacterium]
MTVKAVKNHSFVILLTAALLLAAGLIVFILSSSSLGNSDMGSKVDITGSTEACNTAEDADEPDESDKPESQERDLTAAKVNDTTAGVRYIQVAGKQCIIDFDESFAGIFIENGSDIYRYDVGEGTVIVSDCIADIDGDGADEILLITGDAGQEYGSDFWILRLEMTGGEVSVSDTDRISLKAFNPWKVQTCDVDGDGMPEVSFGVYKTSRFHPVMAKRPFIYDLHENGISPKWRGSRLSRPFDDYIFSDINSDGADEIVSIEHLADGRKAVNSYAWKGFGFEGIGESCAYDDILSIRESESEGESVQAIEACVMVDGQEKWIKLIHDNDVLLVAEDR